MGHIIKAPKVQLHVQPAIIDDTKTRLNIDIHAATAHVAGQWVSRSYNNLEINFTRYCIVATTTIVG
jgi:hypothetical protein